MYDPFLLRSIEVIPQCPLFVCLDIYFNVFNIILKMSLFTSRSFLVVLPKMESMNTIPVRLLYCDFSTLSEYTSPTFIVRSVSLLVHVSEIPSFVESIHL